MKGVELKPLIPVVLTKRLSREALFLKFEGDLRTLALRRLTQTTMRFVT